MSYIPDIDRVRLAEAYRLADKIQDQIWPNWHTAPFAVLLVTPDYEFLVRHPQPSEEFVDMGYDRMLKSRVYYRQRQFETHFLAAFPAVNGLSTVVVGQAESTFVKTSTPWVVTLLHEHFHQLQDAQPHIFEEIDALGLAHGDPTGMWMLNYAFPYTDPEVNTAFATMTKALGEAINAIHNPDLTDKVTVYGAVQKQFRQTVPAEAYRYLQFQLWKEGVARYTEYRVALLAAATYKPGKAFVALPDYIPYTQVAASLHKGIVEELSGRSLAQAQRGAFYPFGAAQALLLDATHSHWQQLYFSEKFLLDAYFDMFF